MMGDSNPAGPGYRFNIFGIRVNGDIVHLSALIDNATVNLIIISACLPAIDTRFKAPAQGLEDLFLRIVSPHLVVDKNRQV